MKDLLLNVGSGGGAAAPAPGGAAAGGAGGAAEEPPKEEEKKEEGMSIQFPQSTIVTDIEYRERGVRRRYGLWSFRLIPYGCHLYISDMCIVLRIC